MNTVVLYRDRAPESRTLRRRYPRAQYMSLTHGPVPLPTDGALRVVFVGCALDNPASMDRLRQAHRVEWFPA